MRKLKTVLFCFLGFILLGQETKRYIGTAYNITLQGGGIISIDLTYNPDGTIIGYLDTDPYIGGVTFCGAGNISGTWENNKVFFSYTSFDPDPNCDFQQGSYLEFDVTVSNDRQILTGTYTSNYFNSNGEFSLRSTQDCANLQQLQSIYQAKKNTNELLYVKQYLCLAQKTCQEFNTTGDYGWAGGFVKYMFDWISTHNHGNSSLDLDCHFFVTKEECFFRSGMYHLINELGPAFFDYCTVIQNQSDIDRWTSDHELFLSNAVDVCFDELIISEDACTFLPPSLCALYLTGAKETTKVFVRSLRDAAQLFCKISQFAGTIDDLASIIPAPASKNELFSNSIDSASAYLVSTNSYELKVGMTYQIEVLKKELGQNINITNSANGTEYSLNVDEDIATISRDGTLTIKSTNLPLINARFPLLIYAKNNGKIGIGQFAIYDVDTDNDLIVNSYETKIGLNPINKNGFNKDSDNDGLHDFFEVMQKTNPKSKDSDNDGFVDPYELGVRSDPLDPQSTPISLNFNTKVALEIIKISSIYPNPFNDYVVINFDVFEDGLDINLKIIDLTGKIVFQIEYGKLVRGYYSNEFDLNLSQGTYFAVLQPSKGNPVMQKILKR